MKNDVHRMTVVAAVWLLSFLAVFGPGLIQNQWDAAALIGCIGVLVGLMARALFNLFCVPDEPLDTTEARE